jgi:NADH-quinone oxidoreductase subunit M
MQTHLLSYILFIPTVTAALVAALPKERLGLIRWTALIASLVPLALALSAWAQFQQANPGGQGFALVEQAVWYPAIGASYKLGLDGVALTMVLLTTLLTPLAILTSFNISEKVKAYMALFLLLETGMLGVFMSLDLFLFFVFWEAGLVPMYFLISQWGGANRNYASLKFILYTMGGSLGLLLAIQLIGVTSGTYDFEKLLTIWPNLKTASGTLLGLPIETVKSIAFWAFVIAFAVKVPIWPFHTWLPDAHTEAPTAGSMILAGVLLKLGAFGFIRLVLPLYPAESQHFAGWLAALATLAILFGAWSAFGQDDFKRMVAYSSINHMGFVVLGIAAAALHQSSTDGIIALNGAVLQMFNHGLYSAGMFFLVGVIYDRAHTRDLNAFGGLYALLPVYGSILIFTSMASLGLPGLNGFVSEFLVVRGAWPVLTAATAISMIGLFFTGAYTLKALWKVLHGPLNPQWAGGHQPSGSSVKARKQSAGHAHVLTEINLRELIVIAPLMALILVIGFWPAWILNVINNAVTGWFGF